MWDDSAVNTKTHREKQFFTSTLLNYLENTSWILKGKHLLYNFAKQFAVQKLSVKYVALLEEVVIKRNALLLVSTPRKQIQYHHPLNQNIYILAEHTYIFQ